MNWSPIYSFLLSEKIYGYCNETVLVNCTWVFQRLKVSNLQKSFFQVFCQVRGKGGGARKLLQMKGAVSTTRFAQMRDASSSI